MNLSIQKLSEAELRAVVGGEFIGLGGILIPDVLPNFEPQ